MISQLLKFVSGKELILCEIHRQTKPLKTMEANRQKYIFVDPGLIWRATGVIGRRATNRFRLMAYILKIISPKYIISMNWLTKRDTLFYVWCKHNKKCKFIVVQHGAYIGGIITDISHQYAKCQVMLCWSDHFRNEFLKYNKAKGISFFLMGNTVYNQYDRSVLRYKNDVGKKILFAPSVILDQRREDLIDFMNRLAMSGCSVFLKEHGLQHVLSKAIDGFAKVEGDLYSLLLKQEYDLIVTDISTTMLDIIFFKNRAVYFSPIAGDKIFRYPNIYGQFLKNAAVDYTENASYEKLTEFVNIEAQEKLLAYLVRPGNNNLDILN